MLVAKFTCKHKILHCILQNICWGWSLLLNYCDRTKFILKLRGLRWLTELLYSTVLNVAKTGSSALPSSVRMYSRHWLGPWPCEGSAGSVENCRAGHQKRRAGSLGCMVSCRSRVEVLVFRKASAVSDVFQLVEPHPPQSNCVTSGTHQLIRDLSIM